MAELYRINRYINSSLRAGRDLPGTIADLKKLRRRHYPEDKEYYCAAVKFAKLQLRLEERPY